MRRAGPGLLAALLATRLAAGEVQLAPFAGLQFGGRLYSPVYGATFSLRAAADFGATLDLSLDETWRVELLYSRQETELRSRSSRRPAFPQAVERYMAGIQEEQESVGPVRLFGIALMGATRLVPGLSDTQSELRFAAALGLGAKVLASRRVGARFEARVFYTVADAGSAVYCRDGECLFRFAGSGSWQGDVTAALVLRF